MLASTPERVKTLRAVGSRSSVSRRTSQKSAHTICHSFGGADINVAVNVQIDGGSVVGGFSFYGRPGFDSRPWGRCVVV